MQYQKVRQGIYSVLVGAEHLWIMCVSTMSPMPGLTASALPISMHQHSSMDYNDAGMHYQSYNPLQDSHHPLESCQSSYWFPIETTHVQMTESLTPPVYTMPSCAVSWTAQTNPACNHSMSHSASHQAQLTTIQHYAISPTSTELQSCSEELGSPYQWPLTPPAEHHILGNDSSIDSTNKTGSGRKCTRCRCPNCQVAKLHNFIKCNTNYYYSKAGKKSCGRNVDLIDEN
ncbi:transcription factor Sp9-like [Vespula squamosa]|uniref:Transcription factor Sp9-like n=1 Tax=Vespula squamosa TaxID=30214 RepID=A0ABD2AQE9_VESSQ